VSKTKQQGGALDIALGALLAKLTLWAAGKISRRLRILAFRWRRALTPLVVGFLVWVVSAIWSAFDPGWWSLLALLLPVGTGVLAYFGPVLNERWSQVVTKVVPAGLDRGKDGVLDRPVERIYLAGFGTAIGGYVAVRSAFGGSDFTLWWWRISVLVLGGLWWYHRRVRSAGRSEKIARKWNRITDRDRCPDNLKAIAGTKVLSSKSRGRAAELHVRLPEAATFAILQRSMDALHSFYKARPDSIFPHRDLNHSNQAYITFQPKNPWEGLLEHSAPEVGTYSIRSLGKKLELGIYSDGEEIVWNISHAGVFGQSGGGKSGFLHNILRWLVGATDALVVGIDMAGGATMNPWKSAFALPLAKDFDSAIVNLQSVMRFVESRERFLGSDAMDDDDADEFEPTDATPWLFLVIDEFPDLIAAAREMGEKEPQLSWEKYVNTLLGRIAKKARKCGVRIIIGSQNATKEDLGKTEFRGQLVTTVGLLLSEQQNKNLWGQEVRLGWTSIGLGQGEFRLRDPQHQTPRVAKGWWVPKADRKLAAVKASQLAKMAEKEAWDALMGTDNVVVVVPGETAPARERDTVLRAFDDSATGILTVPELMEIVGLSRAQTYKRLKGLGEAGKVRALGRRRFARVGDTRVPVSEGAGERVDA
jgi:hypothetical protein